MQPPSQPKLTFVLQHRFESVAGGRVASPEGYSEAFFRERFFEVFPTLEIYSRLANSPAPGPIRLSPEIAFVSLGDWQGLWQFIKVLPRLSLKPLLHGSGPLLIQVPSPLAFWAALICKSAGRKYFCQVISDPHDFLSAGANPHPLRGLLRAAGETLLKMICKGSQGCCYVSEPLRKRYPCPMFETVISDVDLPSEAFSQAPRKFSIQPVPLKLVSVGLSDPCKAHDCLLRALHQVRAAGLDIELRLLGQGSQRAHLERLAHQLGLASSVHFSGWLQADSFRSHLDQADLYICASRAEGMSRALLEAMARGLPCLATRVGGNVELLSQEALLPVGDSGALASRLQWAANRPDWLSQQSTRNHLRAQAYSLERLRPHWKSFAERLNR